MNDLLTSLSGSMQGILVKSKQPFFFYNVFDMSTEISQQTLHQGSSFLSPQTLLSVVKHYI